MGGGGPLTGRTVVELAGLGPAPFAGLLLADMGADVIRVDRPGGSTIPSATPASDWVNRGKLSVVLDLKTTGGVEAALTLASRADVLIEGFRPGVVERLGIGPADVHARNPRLVYGRITGWGQEGPLAHSAGHDITYIAVTGALHAIGSADGAPQVPLNLVGDMGGGSSYLVMGVLAALLEAERTGLGQVIDAAIIDGTAHSLTLVHTMLGSGQWRDERGSNLIDGGMPFYSVYETSDGGWLAVGALEPKFFAELLRLLKIPQDVIAPEQQHDSNAWPMMRAVFAQRFLERTRASWARTFAGTDACVAPVLSLREAAHHEHIVARGTISEVEGTLRAARSPRFSAHPAHSPAAPHDLGADTAVVLEAAGLDAMSLIAMKEAYQA